jgi:hypothetical protein
MAQVYVIYTRQLKRRHLRWLASSACASYIFKDIKMSHKRRSEWILMSRDTGSTLRSLG